MTKIFSLLSVLLISCAASAQTKTTPPIFKSALDSASYAFGANIAADLKERGVTEINTAMLSRAMNDVFGSQQLSISQEKSLELIQAFLKEIDKKKFEIIEYSNTDYLEEIERIRTRFTPLLHICKEYGTAIRIGTNHGSLSDRIMSRYGDTANGMVESAMEFLRIARSENFHNIVLSMKSSNPQVMVQAYRLLINHMMNEFEACYPLHLGVTEAGDGEDGRIKSAIGIGTLLEDGIGDTIRVSLTEDPEFEIPVCNDLVKRYQENKQPGSDKHLPAINKLPYNPFDHKRRETYEISNIGNKHVPVVMADLSKLTSVEPIDLKGVGYMYNGETDKWLIGDAAADYIFCNNEVGFSLPGTLKVICCYDTWQQILGKASHFDRDGEEAKYIPLLDADQYLNGTISKSTFMNFIMVDCYSESSYEQDFDSLFEKLKSDKTAVICLSSTNKNSMQSIRRMFVELINNDVKIPAVIMCDSSHVTIDESLIHYAVETGALLID